MSSRPTPSSPADPSPPASRRSWKWVVLLAVAMLAGFGGGSLTCLGLRQYGILPDASPVQAAIAPVASPSALPVASAATADAPARLQQPPVNVEARVRQNTRITILNGTRRTGLGSEAASLLRESGWTVWVVGTSNRHDLATTEIGSAKPDPTLVLGIAQALGLSGTPEAREHDPTTDVTIVLGDDFTEALRHPHVRPVTPAASGSAR